MSDSHPVMNSSQERGAWSTSGYLMLIAFIALLSLTVARIIAMAGSHPDKSEIFPFVVTTGLMALALVIISAGFYMLQPNQSAAITLFGSYRGSDRNTGLRWVWPWMNKTKISVRANNLISDKSKVNDLRGNHDQVGAELRTELIARLKLAGITVDECGFTHLAYAQEIAGAMLRRQQAEAVVAARKTMVEGAVGMVEMALAMLSEKDVIHLDDERKAAMVSNLMVVLCGERDTQPVVNAGSLYQ